LTDSQILAFLVIFAAIDEPLFEIRQAAAAFEYRQRPPAPTPMSYRATPAGWLTRFRRRLPNERRQAE
jgi:hypothetical protein